MLVGTYEQHWMLAVYRLWGWGHLALTLGCLHFLGLHHVVGPSIYIPASLAGKQGTPSHFSFSYPGQTVGTGKGSRLVLSGSLSTKPLPPPGEVLGPWQPRQRAPKTCFTTSVATRQPAPTPHRPQTSGSGKLEIIFEKTTSADSLRIL